MTKEIKLTDRCKIVYTDYDVGFPAEVEIEYVEQANDYWSSDRETSVSIDKEQAKELIAFLQKAFNL